MRSKQLPKLQKRQIAHVLRAGEAWRGAGCEGGCTSAGWEHELRLFINWHDMVGIATWEFRKGTEPYASWPANTSFLVQEPRDKNI